MPLVVASGAAATAAGLRDLGERLAGPEARRAVDEAAAAIGREARRRTEAVYNLRANAISPYINVRSAQAVKGTALARVELAVRAIPIEVFAPQVRMQTFSYTDSRGRRVTRELPAVYFTRLRGGAPRYLRVAFPLQQRNSGALSAGDSIRRRIGPDRDRLTRLRYFTFPSRFLKQDLLPHLKQFGGDSVRVSLREAIRTLTKRGRTLRRND